MAITLSEEPKTWKAQSGQFDVFARQTPNGKVTVDIEGPGRMRAQLKTDNAADAKAKAEILIDELQTAVSNYQTRVAAL